MAARVSMSALVIVCAVSVVACRARVAPETTPPGTQTQAESSQPPPSPPAEPKAAPAFPPAGPVGAPPHGIAVGAARGVGSGWLLRDFNTESYDRIYDNDWKLVGNDPLSTFSVDVDTASYANVRRFLNSGQRPPRDAVRIEELINYFDYDYPSPDSPRPFSVTTEIGPCPWEPRHRLLLIGLQGRRLAADAVPPRNLVFLIDVSGSMDMPAKLPLVQASMTLLANQLTSRDRVAIVVYAGASGLVLPSTSGDDRSRVLAAIAQLRAGGSTNGAAGIELAYQQASAHFIPGGVNRVILATDGDFNVGVTDRGSLIRLIEDKRRAGIALSVLGFGMGNLKDATLEQLADKGNGNYAYLDTMQEANKVLVTQAGGTLVTIAKDVKLQLEFNPANVAAFRLIGYENRVLAHQDFKDDTKDAGEIGAGHSVTALYELVPRGESLPAVPSLDPLRYQSTPTQTSNSNDWLMVKLRYKMPDEDSSIPMDVAVTPGDRSGISRNLGFASAIASFGMVLRGTEHRGGASFDMAVDLARKHRGEDPHGHRAEFVRLAEVAKSLTAAIHE